MTLKGEEALNQLMNEDKEMQSLNHKIDEMILDHPSQCTSWGIPMAPEKYTHCIEIK
jgi:hypothetical protein